MSATKIKRQRVLDMQSQGLSMRDIGKMLGCSKSSVSKLANGLVEEIHGEPDKMRRKSPIKRASKKRCKCGALMNEERAKHYDECLACQIRRQM